MGRIFAPCFLKRRFQFHGRDFLRSLAAAVILHRRVEVRVTGEAGDGRNISAGVE
jgi:hypothetical protein